MCHRLVNALYLLVQNNLTSNRDARLIYNSVSLILLSVPIPQHVSNNIEHFNDSQKTVASMTNFAFKFFKRNESWSLDLILTPHISSKTKIGIV